MTSDASGALKFCGWNTDGMQRFNELCQAVKNSRVKYPEFDNTFLQQQMNCATTQSPQKWQTNKHLLFMMTWTLKKFDDT